LPLSMRADPPQRTESIPFNPFVPFNPYPKLLTL